MIIGVKFETQTLEVSALLQPVLYLTVGTTSRLLRVQYPALRFHHFLGFFGSTVHYGVTEMGMTGLDRLWRSNMLHFMLLYFLLLFISILSSTGNCGVLCVTRRKGRSPSYHFGPGIRLFQPMDLQAL